MIKNKKLLFVSLLIIIPSYADMGHYYKALFLPNVYDTDTCNWHTKLRLYYGHGNTNKGRNILGETTPILDIHGEQNWLKVLQGVPPNPSITSLRNIADTLVTDAQANGASPQFGKLSFDGTFAINDFMFFLRQNLKCGFFIKGSLPFRDLTIDEISFTDLSPDTGEFSKSNPDWVTLKDNINRILHAYDLHSYQNPFKKTVLGDLMASFGWQHVFCNIPGAVIDLLSIRIEAGFSVPTGSTLDLSEPFALPGGYLKHFGLGGRANMLIGFASYLQLGLEIDGIKFIDKTVTRRMRTNINQSGFIALALGKAYEMGGDRYGFTPFIVFRPPFISNLTLLAAYSYQRQKSFTLCPKDTQVFDTDIVNAFMTGYVMNLIHLKVNYKFDYFSCIVPTIDIFTDIPIRAKHIFSTTMIGCGLGINLNWNF